MTIRILFIFLFFLTFNSCQTESLTQEEVPDQNFELLKNNSELSSKMSCSILAAVVQGRTCFNSGGEQGYIYTTYASSGTNQVNYDRQVEIYMVDSDQNIVETKLVVIQANTNVSNSVAVFSNESNAIGDITVEIANVFNLSTGQLDNSCSFTDTTYTVQNCFESNSGGGGNDYCLGDDDDGDGICSDSDPDDNDPCNPSC